MKKPNRVGNDLSQLPAIGQSKPSRRAFGRKAAPASPSELEVTRYGSRNWAVWLEGELLVVALYKRGATSVADKLRELSGLKAAAYSLMQEIHATKALLHIMDSALILQLAVTEDGYDGMDLAAGFGFARERGEKLQAAYDELRVSLSSTGEAAE